MLETECLSMLETECLSMLETEFQVSAMNGTNLQKAYTRFQFC